VEHYTKHFIKSTVYCKVKKFSMIYGVDRILDRNIRQVYFVFNNSTITSSDTQRQSRRQIFSKLCQMLCKSVTVSASIGLLSGSYHMYTKVSYLTHQVDSWSLIIVKSLYLTSADAH